MVSRMEGIEFGYLRCTNAPPTSHDKTLIHNIIGNIDYTISQVDRDIAILGKQLETLKARRLWHLERRSHLASLASPLRSMPLEILGEIFLYACAERLSARLGISHVCRLWRHAALSTSELWSTIDGDFPDFAEVMQEYVQACVDRARTRPLTLVHRAQPCPDYNASDVILKATENCRWKEYSWTSRWLRLLEPVMSALVSTSHDTLETLELFCPRQSGRTLKMYIGTAFKKLTKLSITMDEPLDPGTLEAPWSKLTKLSLTSTRVDDATILNILRQCSNVEECALSFPTFGTTLSYNGSRPIYLPKLRKLHLSNNPELFNKITRILITPNLEDLIIDSVYAYEGDVDHDESVYRYLLSNAKTLRRLWICGISTTQVQDVITRLDSLHELTLVFNDGISVDDFEALELPQDEDEIEANTIPLPHLCALRVICDVNSPTQLAFADLVRSRWRDDCEDPDVVPSVPRCLRYASLQEKSRLSLRNVFAEIEELKDAGLDVSILNPGADEYTPSFRYFDQ